MLAIALASAIFRERAAEPTHRTSLQALAPQPESVSLFVFPEYARYDTACSIHRNTIIVARELKMWQMMGKKVLLSTFSLLTTHCFPMYPRR